MSEIEPYIDVKEAAAFLRRSPKNVQQLARQGKLPAYPTRTSRKAHWLFKKTELDIWVRSARESESHPCS